MSHSRAKKLRKEVRKNFEKEIGEGMRALGYIVRKRPPYIPKQLWILLYLPLFKWSHIPTVYRHLD